MKMSDKMEDAFSRQVTLELESAMVYLQMSAHFQTQDLPGMAAWMRAQSEEEREHALRFLDFVLDRGNQVRIGAIDAPKASYEGPAAVFGSALEHEQEVSEAIRDLFRLAQSEGDVDSLPILQGFIEEQIEEEATVSEILGQLAKITDDSAALLMIDRELGSRGSADG